MLLITSMPRPAPSTDPVMLALPTTLDLRTLIDRSDLPAALRAAATATHAHGAATVGAALQPDAPAPLITALLALDAQVVLHKEATHESLTLEDLLIARENAQSAGEPSDEGSIAAVAFRRTEATTTLADRDGLAVVVAIDVAEGMIRRARIAASGIAPLPLRLRQVEAVLLGRRSNGDTSALVRTAAETARGEAHPSGVGQVWEAAQLDQITTLCAEAIRLTLIRPETQDRHNSSQM